MEFINWLDMNIEFEQTILQRIKEQFGAFNIAYKTKLNQINELIKTKNKYLILNKK